MVQTDILFLMSAVKIRTEKTMQTMRTIPKYVLGGLYISATC